MDRLTISGTSVISGSAKGTALVSSEPLSFWGGYDWKSGEITDRRHPLSGWVAAEKILVIPFTRGSSTTTAVLLEAIRAGTAPAAIITTETDFFFALASVVADELYAKPLPLLAISESDFARLHTGDLIEINEHGNIFVHRNAT